MDLDLQIKPFQINIDQDQLDDLRQRLDHTRWPVDHPELGWSHGIPVGYLRELAGYWRDGYDWRSWERQLNSYPQFTTVIDDYDLHFLHIRSGEAAATPLLLLHGWPGSIVEFLDLIDPLTDPVAHGGAAPDAFDVVIPSIPGFGFGGPTPPGWTAARVAAAMVELMQRLDYDRFAVHGGDFGAITAREMSLSQPERLIGLHVTDLFGAGASPENADFSVEAERLSVEAHYRYEYELGAYAMIQATRPLKVSYGLMDSPVFQLAWIVEGFKDYTDSTDAPEDAVDRDAMLTNVMIYWLCRTAGSSARYYKEGLRAWGEPEEPSIVPTAVAHFRHNIMVPIRRLAEPTNNIVRWTEFDRGGHFAAMEEPDLVTQDLRESFRAAG